MNTLGGLVISIVVITVVIPIISKQSTAEELLCSDQEFYFEFPNVQPNVNIERDTDIEAFTICLWLSTSTVSNLGILRYTSQSTSNVLVALSLSSVGYLFFSLFGDDRQLQVLPGVQDGNWHGLCVTWQKLDGFFMVYYDGRLLLTGTDYKTGQLASFKGIFTLGIGTQSFLYTGRLSHVNAWPSVLHHPQLAVLSSKCGVERGEIVSWPEFKQGQYGVAAMEGVACPLTETNITNELKHWRLDGSDDELSPYYSASFVEGRLDDHKAVYLDQTMAYLEAPFVDLGTTFTIACWVKLLPSNPYLKPILFSENNGSSNGRFWFGINADNKLLFENSNLIGPIRNEVNEALHENLWLHVAVSLTTSNELLFYINGLKHLSSSLTWQSPTTGPFAIGKFYITSESKHVYFHGFLSDLYVFSRALSADEIGQIMGRSLPCTFSEWSSHSMLTPGQKPTENRRTKSCPGVGQCTEVRVWKPADCREVLLAGHQTSGVYTVSPLNDEDEFDVFCDQDTQGGGWTVIQQRSDGSLSFYKTWDEYKNGFGAVGSQSEMWLGNDKIHSLTAMNTELLIQLEAFDGRKGFAMYSDFHVAGENDDYRLSLGNFSGNLFNKLGTHSNATFRVDNCADVQGVGWWFTPSCGEVLLNSQYGQNTGVMKWDDFPNSGDAGGTLMKTSMKIRRTEGYSGDYTLIFRKNSSETSMSIWRTILTEFKAFTVCLWHKLYVREKSGKLSMTLLRYFTEDGNFTLIIKDFNGDGGPTLSLIIWPRYDSDYSGNQYQYLGSCAPTPPPQ